jgi:hypothetical protein
MGLRLRRAGLRGRGVAAKSEAGEGKRSFALGVGDKGVGKPGYFLPTSVRRERLGRVASGWGSEAWRLPMLKMGLLPVY